MGAAGAASGAAAGGEPGELAPSMPEMALPGCREYQTPPAISSNEAAMPRKRPIFEPEEAASAGCADSPSSWPPNIATSGRCEDSCASELLPSSVDSATTDSNSANEFDSTPELCTAAGVS